MSSSAALHQVCRKPRMPTNTQGTQFPGRGAKPGTTWPGGPQEHTLPPTLKPWKVICTRGHAESEQRHCCNSNTHGLPSWWTGLDQLSQEQHQAEQQPRHLPWEGLGRTERRGENQVWLGPAAGWNCRWCHGPTHNLLGAEHNALLYHDWS